MMASVVVPKPNQRKLSHEEQVEFYRKRVGKLIKQAEQVVDQFTKYDNDYAALDEFLTETPKYFKRKHKIPLGKYAFMPGELIHTNEVMVSLGDNWFMECSASHARDIVARRREYAQSQKDIKEGEIKELKLRFSFSDQSRIDADGDEINEDGLKYVEIREEADNEGNLLNIDQKAVQPKQEEPSKPNPAKGKAPAHSFSQTPSKKLDDKVADDFDKKLLARFAELEEEEEEEASQRNREKPSIPVVEEDGSDENNEDDDVEDEIDAQERREFEEYDSGLRADSDEDDFNPEPVHTPRSNASRTRPAPPSVSKSAAKPHASTNGSKVSPAGKSLPCKELPPIRTPGDIYHRMRMLSDQAEAAKTNQSDRASVENGDGSESGREPLIKSEVVEYEDLVGIPAEDLEDYYFGRELADEYNQRRQIMLEKQKVALEETGEREIWEHEQSELVGSKFKTQKLLPLNLGSEIKEYVMDNCLPLDDEGMQPPDSSIAKPSQPTDAPTQVIQAPSTKPSKQVFKPNLAAANPPKSSSQNLPKPQQVIPSPSSNGATVTQLSPELAVTQTSLNEPPPPPPASVDAKPKRISRFKASRQQQQQQPTVESLDKDTNTTEEGVSKSVHAADADGGTSSNSPTAPPTQQQQQHQEQQQQQQSGLKSILKKTSSFETFMPEELEIEKHRAMAVPAKDATVKQEEVSAEPAVKDVVTEVISVDATSHQQGKTSSNNQQQRKQSVFKKCRGKKK